MPRILRFALMFVLSATAAVAGYANFESGHVHPIALTPAQDRLLVVNTPDALLESFLVAADGTLTADAAIPVGLEPVTVRARSDTEAWVVNHLSDSVSIVDLTTGLVTRTLKTGDEPTDVVFAQGKAFVAASQLDRVEVFDLADLDAAPALVPLFSRDVRALARSADGSEVYAVTLRSGNQTTVMNGNVATFPDPTAPILRGDLIDGLGIRDLSCSAAPPPLPDMPEGIERNPTLTDPPAGEIPTLSLIVSWDEASGAWVDEDGFDWNACLPYRLPDEDLFIIDTSTLEVSSVPHLGTSLLDVSVHPGGKIYVPNTDARNHIRFEHPLGLNGHLVDNRFSIVDRSAGNAVTIVDLNTHIDRSSVPATNASERQASVSQPGMLVWSADGSVGYMTAIGSRKLFRVDGSCLAGSCVFGPDRSAPAAVEVGHGPSGVALAESLNRLYVLNRVDHSLAIVEASSLTLLDQLPLHDPSSESTRRGRRFLYDAVDLSRHGDAACSSCHLFGDMDGLAWELGNPEDEMVPYSKPDDNVRFIKVVNGTLQTCEAEDCAGHEGFDPQKGPMTTQTLRGMLEPLHWRGDRATMYEFNRTFVELMGAADIGSGDGEPAGLGPMTMEHFRQFSLDIRFPPNPYRNLDDTLPCGPRSSDPNCEVSLPGMLRAGNPTQGELIYDNQITAGGNTGARCQVCHAHPFGAAGGTLGGVEPTDPTSSQSAGMRNSPASPHSDIKIGHLRNIYEKFGPVWAEGSAPPPLTRTGFGYVHDGSIPDVLRLIVAPVFNLPADNNSQQVRDLGSFLFHFATSTKPAVGQQVTLPPGLPTGTPDDLLVGALIELGDAAVADRHCELVAVTRAQGRNRRYQLFGGSWVTDTATDPPIGTLALLANAEGPVTFTCAALGEGARLGGNRDEDPALDGDDCAAGNAGAFARPSEVTSLHVEIGPTLSWDDQIPSTGAATVYDVLSGSFSQYLTFTSYGLQTTACAFGDRQTTGLIDTRTQPAPGTGFFYLVRAENICGDSGVGSGRETVNAITCAP